MNTPLISAIFSTYNRASFLRHALQSLVTQSLPKSQFEAIVVDDGSTDQTRQVVADFETLLPIRYAYQTHGGLAQGKNNAIQLAKAPIILFMDDDDIADPNLLAEHLKTHHEYPDQNIAVLGFTNLREDISASPLMHFVTQVGFYLFSYPKIKHGDVLDYTYFWGGRSSCKKDFLVQHGLFDPIFKFGCEDIELGYRLSKYGFKVVYNKNACSTMIRSISLDEFCERAKRQGRSNWLFHQKHPVPEITKWTDVEDLDARWKIIEPRLNQNKKSARELERIVLARMKNAVFIDPSLSTMLQSAYWSSIDGHRVEGAWLAQEEQEVQVQFYNVNTAILKKIYDERPKFHYWNNVWQDGGLSNQMLQACAKYGLYANNDGPIVIETGAGLSTLVFLAIGSKKVYSIAPDASLKDKIFDWCNKNDLPTEYLNFTVDYSEIALPEIVLQRNAFADMILIDGGHGWPTVFVDFCYGNYALKKGGIIGIDDNQLHSISELINLLTSQNGFTLLEKIHNKLVFFKKEYDIRLLPDFGGQPYIKLRSTPAN